MSSKKVRFDRLILHPTALVRMGAELHIRGGRYATIMMISLTPAVSSSSGCIYYRQPHQDMDLPQPIIVVTSLTHQAEETDVVAASKG